MSEKITTEESGQHLAADTDDHDDPLSGLSDDEARAFHSAFLRSFRDFTLLALIAHGLLWAWHPWLR